MAAIASTEFIALCQAQLQLLTTQIVAASAAVYMTAYWTDSAESKNWSEDSYSRGVSGVDVGGMQSEPNFVPVASYPESIEQWTEAFEKRQSSDLAPLRLPAAKESSAVTLKDLSSSQLQPEADCAGNDASEYLGGRSVDASADSAGIGPLGYQLVVPLVYSGVVVGLVVAIRRDRTWKSEERHHVEGVAQSLAAGCVLERRSQWLQTQLSDKRDLQSRQSEIFHNLLHQFRNPLTAVTTFGQLLVRRLESEDPNQRIATGIVRESKRLREMVSHFDETVAIGDAHLQAESAANEVDETLRLPPAAAKLLPGSSALDDESPVEIPLSDQNHPDVSANSKVPFANDVSVSESVVLGHALTLSAQSLPDVLEPILSVSDIVAKEKGVKLHAQVAQNTPPVWGEEESLGEVISNLVDNAVKYSPAGACVFVQTGVSRFQGEHHYQGVVVADTGPGIPESDRTRLFERNYRGVQAEGNIPGTGLGLAIARSLITQMHGEIEVISPAAGTPWLPPFVFEQAKTSGPGTVFIVWLAEVSTSST